MPLQVGARLGPYEVLALIGAGGMGEVYRARDTKLKRDVALKVLPDLVATDSDRLARFHREAELLAALNHPNIAHIYGFEDSDRTHALVMELVDGPTLADRLAYGPILLSEALPIARQIAEALEAAHEQGVIHRDLKPANIKVRDDGTVKVLDFGLAKMLDLAPGSGLQAPGGLTASPTITTPAMMTGVGMILGTAAYMSPEQARGRTVDRRTDVWAFGCVLFEMLTGGKAFEVGDTVSDAIAAVLKNEPDWNALPPDTPAYVTRLLRRCLQKDPQKRLPHIGVARLEIEEGPVETPTTQPIVTPEARFGLKAGPYGWVAAALLLIVSAALGASLLLRREPADVGSARFTFAPPEGWRLGHNVPGRGTGEEAPHAAVSPDGRSVAYVMYSTGTPQLWVKRLDALDGQPLADTDDASFPFWSPDGRFIAFFAAHKLRKIAAAGGPPQTICDAPIGWGGTWNLDGDIVFAPDATGPLSRVSAAGGVPTSLTTLDSAAHETWHRWPQFLPDGRHFLFLAGGSTTDLFVGSLDSPDRSLVMKRAQRTLYASGHLLFVSADTLWAQPFDPASRRLSGEPTPLAEGVPLGNGMTGVSASETGVLAYRALPIAKVQVTRFDRAGNRLEVVGTPGSYEQLRLAPGDRLLAVNERPRREWWILDLARGGVAERLTAPTGGISTAFWSPDGARLVFVSGTPIKDLYEKAVAGSGNEELLLKTPFSKGAGDWSEAAQHIIYSETRPETGQDLWTLPLTKDARPQPYLQTSYSENRPRFSPDGRWVAYQSNEGGRSDVYVRAFPGGDRKTRVSVTGGDLPIWRRDGRELFYLDGARLMAVDVRTGTAFESGTPHVLFETRLPPGFEAFGLFEATGSGQQFLIAEPPSADAGRAITVVVSWPSLLKQ